MGVVKSDLCDERVKPKSEESTRLVYSGLLGVLEHLKIETRLIDEKFASVMGECVIQRVFCLLFRCGDDPKLIPKILGKIWKNLIQTKTNEFTLTYTDICVFAYYESMK